jgi:phosphatidylinositol dimannoside acyltransferase
VTGPAGRPSAAAEAGGAVRRRGRRRDGTLVELGYATGWRVVRALPEPAARATFRVAADAAAARRGPAVRQLATNLRRVVGPDLPGDDMDRLVRAGMRSYARYWMEAFRLPSWSPARIQRGFRLAGWERLREASESGTGAVVALPHAGNWDAGGAWVAAQGCPLTTVAERLRPEGLYERFLRFRRNLGMRIVPLRGGERPPLDLLAEALAEGHIVPLLSDRDLSARGIEVEFFGATARMPAGPAILALRTGAPLYVIDMWFEDDAACGRLSGPLDLPADGSLDQRIRVLTQHIADRLAAGIAENPADWHMLQRLWLADRAGGRSPGAGPEDGRRPAQDPDRDPPERDTG